MKVRCRVAVVGRGIVVSIVAAVGRGIVVESIIDAARMKVGDASTVGALSLMVVASRSVDAAGGIAVVSCTIDAVVVVSTLHGGDMSVVTIGVDIRVSLLACRVEFGDCGIEALVAFCRSHADRGDSE